MSRWLRDCVGLGMLAIAAGCGGGGGPRLEDADGTAAAIAAADDAARAQATAGVTGARRAVWQTIATEWQPFTLSTPTLVRYGAGEAWVRMLMPAGTSRCTNAVMGTDPAPHVVKRCEALTAVAASDTPAPPSSSPATGTPPPATTTAKLQASRLAGVAPLAVLFDATGSRFAGVQGDAFTAAQFSFDYGDERGTSWRVSGLPKNTDQGGPIAAHVFETPGRYTVTVRVSHGGGPPAEATVTLNVLDPKAYYAGAATVCVSGSGDFSGCPDGAARRATLPAGTEWNRRRVLLRRGEAFGEVAVTDGNSGVTVGAFGSGAAPEVESVGVGAWRPRSAQFATDVTVMDLAVADGITQCLGSRVLLLRNALTGPGPKNAIYIGGVGYWAVDDPYRTVPTEAFHHAREIFLVENTVIGSTAGDGYNVYGDAAQLALLGNVMGTSMYHTVRLTGAHKAVLAHNELRGQTSAETYHVLKIHSSGLGDYADAFGVSGRQWASDQIVVANNVFGHPANLMQWTVAISPQNDRYREGVRDVIVTGNRFHHGRATVQDLTFGGRNLVQRNNQVAGGGTLAVGVGHTGGLPASWNGPYGLR